MQTTGTGLIPAEVIDEVRERTDLVQVISQHVQLRRSGANFQGLCPFHDEKTPSFSVNPGRQFYHCFGCHESGDAIRFLMRIEGRSFVEVVEDLAGRAGVTIERKQGSDKDRSQAVHARSERQQALDTNRLVADLYRALLAGDEGQEARRYLAGRGLTQETIETFELGYAPGDGRHVAGLLQRKRVPLELGERMGLVARRGGEARDRFFRRVIFPVVGAAGEVIGFGGRLIGDGDGPKYINTPETSVYRKGETLFGLGPAAKEIRQKRTVVIVEGNVDVLSVYQAGHRNVVAPMGTALTPQQVTVLARFAERAVVMLDGDAAGRAAARKAIGLLVRSGLDTYAVALPAGEDPDSLIVREGVAGLEKQLTGALPAVDYLLADLGVVRGAPVPERARALEAVAPTVAALKSAAERAMYAGRIALLLDIDPRVVERAIRGIGPVDSERLGPSPVGRKSNAPRVRVHLPQGELDLVGILIEHPHLTQRAEAADVSGLLTNEGLRATYRALVEMQQAEGQVQVAQLLDEASEGVRDAIAVVASSSAFASLEDPTRAMDECVMQLRRRRLEGEREAILCQMAEARRAGDTDAERTLAVRRIELEREIHETR